jgi:hypothetical protein
MTVNTTARTTASKQESPSIFARANDIFDGWNDPQTGMRVLRIATNETEVAPGVAPEWCWRTHYHQLPCFLDGGRKVLLRTGAELKGARVADSAFMDLTTGEVWNPFPADCYPVQVNGDNLAILYRKNGRLGEMMLWDIRAEKALVTLPSDGWGPAWWHFLCDGRRAIFAQSLGTGWVEGYYRSRMFLVGDDGSCEPILEADGAICNHVQCHPTDPDILAYVRWPTPWTYQPQVIRIRTLDGSSDELLPLPDGALLPGHAFVGLQRDHFLWTPDGARIASYVSPLEDADGCADHFDYGWHISVTDWRTGEDLSAPYPPQRWGGNFTVSPDSRFVVSAGGKEFQCLYAVDIKGLRNGWNEHVLCAYPRTEVDGDNLGLFHMPWVLPDGSGVIFTAGWNGPETGVYLVEWPSM